MSLSFKTDRIRDEYSQLVNKNNRLFVLLVELERFVRENLNKDVVCTCILRTKAENDALYAETPVELRPKSAPHTTWEAADLRSSIYTDDEIHKILNYVISNYKNANGKVPAIYHMISGNVPHFHFYQQL